MNSSKGTFRYWLTGFAALASFAITLSLGAWQLNRAHEKQALGELAQQRSELPALDGQAILELAQVEHALHRKVNLTGHWLDQHTLFLDNRQMQGRVGFFVLTPFVIESQGLHSNLKTANTILVQRGWIARDFMDRTKLPKIATDSGRVQIVGRIALAPSKLYEFKGVESGPIRQNVSLDALAQEFNINLLSFSLTELDTTAHREKTGGLSRQWFQAATGVEKHYGYMVQWWALSALIALLYAWFQVRPFLQTHMLFRKPKK